MDTYDVAVIGAGPGGYIAAITSARSGLKTILIEKDSAGGLCLNWGCIPSKILLKTAAFHKKLKKLTQEGIYKGRAPDLDIATLFKSSRSRVKDISKGLAGLIESQNVRLVYGSARLTPSGSVIITDKKNRTEIKSSNVIIATGAAQKQLGVIPQDKERIISSKEALGMSDPPHKLCIIGGGAIGCEMASLFSALGTEVVLFEIMPQLLPGIDADISERLKNEFEVQGIKVHLSVQISRFKKLPQKIELAFIGNRRKETENTDCILIAAGIAPSPDELGLKNIGVAFGRHGFILADPHTYRTNIPNICAIGDAIELSSGETHPALAHVASAEGEIAAEMIARGSSPWKIDYANIPLAIFTDPEIGVVGHTEVSARKEFKDGFRMQTVLDSWLGAGIAFGETGFTKLLTENRFDTIIGAHIIGYAATERIHQFSIAQRAEETVETMVNQLMAHPTFSESAREALLALCVRSAHIPRELSGGKI